MHLKQRFSSRGLMPRVIIQTSDPLRFRTMPDNNEEIITPEQAVRALGQRVDSCNIIKMDLHFVRIKYQVVSRLELEATRNVVLSVGIFLLFSSPWIISSVLAHICNGNIIQNKAIYISEDKTTTEAHVEQCSRYYWAISYSRLIYLIGHFMHQFFCYVSRSKDFCAGLCQSHIRRHNGCLGGKNSTEKVRYHPKRMETVHIPRCNRQPRDARLRLEHLQRNGELYVSCCTA